MIIIIILIILAITITITIIIIITIITIITITIVIIRLQQTTIGHVDTYTDIRRDNNDKINDDQNSLLAGHVDVCL